MRVARLTTIAFALFLVVGAPSALAAPPTPVTLAATGITPVGATLNGTVDPRGLETNAFFQYGLTKKYGKRTPAGSVGAGSGPVAASAAVAGLQSNKTYHFRVVGTSTGGTHFGADKAFKTAKPTTTPVFSQNPVRFGDPVAVAGQIVGSNVAGAQVSLFGRPFPFTEPLAQFGNTVLADSQGNYVFILAAALTTAQFEVRGKTNPAFTSTIQTLQVASRISFGAPSTVKKGRKARFHGFVQPAQDGIVVAVQRRRGPSDWVAFATTTLRHRKDGSSDYSLRRKVGRGGTFRAIVQSAGGAVVPNKSIVRRVRVRR
jgi:hypothetical protein